MPAVYAVGMLSPSAGDAGSTAATFTGGIALNTTLPTQAGQAVVTAATPTAAIQAALVNTITASFAGQTASYEPGDTTIDTTPAAHLPFVVTTSTTASQYVLHLEDLANMPGQTPDWDYNDRTWTVTVVELTTISVSPPTAAEERADGSKPVDVAFTRVNGTAGSLDEPLDLPITIGGTAQPGVNYTPPTASMVVFWPGQAVAHIVMPVIDNQIPNDPTNPPTVVITPDPPVGVDPTPPPPVSVPIYDDPGTVPPVPPPATLPQVWVSGSLDGEERSDGLRPVVFQLSRTNPNSPNNAPALTVGFSLSGVATVGVDYTTPYSFMATFAPGELTTLVTLGVPTDDLDEGYESVTLTALPGGGYTVVSGSATGVADIFDLGTMPPARGVASVSGTVWLDGQRNNLQDPFVPLSDSPMAAVRVTLLDGNGSVFLSTYTDAAGNYSFSRLPYGQYQVVVSLWGLEQFVLPHFGGSPNSAIDSDVNADGRTDVFQLSPANPNADRDAGAYLADPPNTNAEKAIYIMQGANHPLLELKVAKWFKTDTKKNEAFVDGVAKDANNVVLPSLGTVDELGYDHIDWDPDRFNVFVKDTAKRGQQAIDVTISTKKKDNGGAAGAINDNATKITLVNFWKEGLKEEWKEWFWSDSQMLVSNTADNTFKRAAAAIPKNANNKKGGGIGEDNVDTSKEAYPNATPDNLNYKNGYNFLIGDRTHRVALGEFVKVEYPDATPVEVEVKVRKTLKVTVYPMKQAGQHNGDPWVTAAQVEAAVQEAREIFAQVGIAIEADIKLPRTVPGTVNLSDGLDNLSIDVDTTDTVNPGIYKLSSEMKDLLEDVAGRTGPVQPGVDDIEVYWVNNIKEGLIAISMTRSWIKNGDEALHADAVFIGEKGLEFGTLAHELFHVLENRKSKIDSHYPNASPRRKAVGAERVNLMVSAEVCLTDKRPVGNIQAQILWSRRLTNEQEVAADTAAKRDNPASTELLK